MCENVKLFIREYSYEYCDWYKWIILIDKHKYCWSNKELNICWYYSQVYSYSKWLLIPFMGQIELLENYS